MHIIRMQWRSKGPAGPTIAEGHGAEGLARGLPGRSSGRNPLARSLNKLFAGARKSSLATLLGE